MKKTKAKELKSLCYKYNKHTYIGTDKNILTSAFIGKNKKIRLGNNEYSLSTAKKLYLWLGKAIKHLEGG